MAGWRQKHSLTHTVMLKLEEEKTIRSCSCRSDACMMIPNIRVVAVFRLVIHIQPPTVTELIT